MRVLSGLGGEGQPQSLTACRVKREGHGIRDQSGFQVDSDQRRFGVPCLIKSHFSRMLAPLTALL